MESPDTLRIKGHVEEPTEGHTKCQGHSKADDNDSSSSSSSSDSETDSTASDLSFGKPPPLITADVDLTYGKPPNSFSDEAPISFGKPPVISDGTSFGRPSSQNMVGEDIELGKPPNIVSDEVGLSFGKPPPFIISDVGSSLVSQLPASFSNKSSFVDQDDNGSAFGGTEWQDFNKTDDDKLIADITKHQQEFELQAAVEPSDVTIEIVAKEGATSEGSDHEIDFSDVGHHDVLAELDLPDLVASASAKATVSTAQETDSAHTLDHGPTPDTDIATNQEMLFAVEELTLAPSHHMHIEPDIFVDIPPPLPYDNPPETQNELSLNDQFLSPTFGDEVCEGNTTLPPESDYHGIDGHVTGICFRGTENEEIPRFVYGQQELIGNSENPDEEVSGKIEQNEDMHRFVYGQQEVIGDFGGHSDEGVSDKLEENVDLMCTTESGICMTADDVTSSSSDDTDSSGDDESSESSDDTTDTSEESAEHDENVEGGYLASRCYQERDIGSECSQMDLDAAQSLMSNEAQDVLSEPTERELGYATSSANLDPVDLHPKPTKIPLERVHRSPNNEENAGVDEGRGFALPPIEETFAPTHCDNSQRSPIAHSAFIPESTGESQGQRRRELDHDGLATGYTDWNPENDQILDSYNVPTITSRETNKNKPNVTPSIEKEIQEAKMEMLKLQSEIVDMVDELKRLNEKKHHQSGIPSVHIESKVFDECGDNSESVNRMGNNAECGVSLLSFESSLDDRSNILNRELSMANNGGVHHELAMTNKGDKLDMHSAGLGNPPTHRNTLLGFRIPNFEQMTNPTPFNTPQASVDVPEEETYTSSGSDSDSGGENENDTKNLTKLQTQSLETSSATGNHTSTSCTSDTSGEDTDGGAEHDNDKLQRQTSETSSVKGAHTTDSCTSDTSDKDSDCISDQELHVPPSDFQVPLPISHIHSPEPSVPLSYASEHTLDRHFDNYTLFPSNEGSGFVHMQSTSDESGLSSETSDNECSEIVNEDFNENAEDNIEYIDGTLDVPIAENKEGETGHQTTAEPHVELEDSNLDENIDDEDYRHTLETAAVPNIESDSDRENSDVHEDVDVMNPSDTDNAKLLLNAGSENKRDKGCFREHIGDIDMDSNHVAETGGAQSAGSKSEIDDIGFHEHTSGTGCYGASAADSSKCGNERKEFHEDTSHKYRSHTSEADTETSDSDSSESSHSSTTSDDQDDDQLPKAGSPRQTFSVLAAPVEIPSSNTDPDIQNRREMNRPQAGPIMNAKFESITPDRIDRQDNVGRSPDGDPKQTAHIAKKQNNECSTVNVKPNTKGHVEDTFEINIVSLEDETKPIGNVKERQDTRPSAPKHHKLPPLKLEIDGLPKKDTVRNKVKRGFVNQLMGLFDPDAKLPKTPNIKPKPTIKPDHVIKLNSVKLKSVDAAAVPGKDSACDVKETNELKLASVLPVVEIIDNTNTVNDQHRDQPILVPTKPEVGHSHDWHQGDEQDVHRAPLFSRPVAAGGKFASQSKHANLDAHPKHVNSGVKLAIEVHRARNDANRNRVDHHTVSASPVPLTESCPILQEHVDEEKEDTHDKHDTTAESIVSDILPNSHNLAQNQAPVCEYDINTTPTTPSNTPCIRLPTITNDNQQHVDKPEGVLYDIITRIENRVQHGEPVQESKPEADDTTSDTEDADSSSNSSSESSKSSSESEEDTKTCETRPVSEIPEAMYPYHVNYVQIHESDIPIVLQQTHQRQYNDSQPQANHLPEVPKPLHHSYVVTEQEQMPHRYGIVEQPNSNGIADHGPNFSIPDTDQSTVRYKSLPPSFTRRLSEPYFRPHSNRKSHAQPTQASEVDLSPRETRPLARSYDRVGYQATEDSNQRATTPAVLTRSLDDKHNGYLKTGQAYGDQPYSNVYRTRIARPNDKSSKRLYPDFDAKKAFRNTAERWLSRPRHEKRPNDLTTCLNSHSSERESIVDEIGFTCYDVKTPVSRVTLRDRIANGRKPISCSNVNQPQRGYGNKFVNVDRSKSLPRSTTIMGTGAQSDKQEINFSNSNSSKTSRNHETSNAALTLLNQNQSDLVVGTNSDINLNNSRLDTSTKPGCTINSAVRNTTCSENNDTDLNTGPQATGPWSAASMKNDFYHKPMGVHVPMELASTNEVSFQTPAMSNLKLSNEGEATRDKIHLVGINGRQRHGKTKCINSSPTSPGKVGRGLRTDDSQIAAYRDKDNTSASSKGDGHRRSSLVIQTPGYQHVLEDENGKLKIWPYSDIDNIDKLPVTLHKAKKGINVPVPGTGMQDSKMTVLQSASDYSSQMAEDTMTKKYQASSMVSSDKSSGEMMKMHGDSVQSVLLQDTNGNALSQEELNAVLPKIAETISKLDNTEAQEILPGISQSITRLKSGGNLVITTMTRSLDEEETTSSGRGSPVPAPTEHPMLNIDDLENSKLYLVRDSQGELFYVEDVTSESQESAYFSSSGKTSDNLSEGDRSPISDRISNVQTMGSTGIQGSTANEILSAMFGANGVQEIDEQEEEWSERTYEYDRTPERPPRRKNSYKPQYMVEEPESLSRATANPLLDMSQYQMTGMPWMYDGGMAQTYSQMMANNTAGTAGSVVAGEDNMSMMSAQQNAGGSAGKTIERYTIEGEIIDYPIVPPPPVEVFVPPPPMVMAEPMSLVKVNVAPPPTKEESTMVAYEPPPPKVEEDILIYKTVAHIQPKEKAPAPPKREVKEKKKYKILSSKSTETEEQESHMRFEAAQSTKVEEQESHMRLEDMDFKFSSENVEYQQSPAVAQTQYFVRNTSPVQAQQTFKSEKKMDLARTASDQTYKSEIQVKEAKKESVEQSSYSYDEMRSEMQQAASNMRVVRGSYLIKNTLDGVDGMLDDNINMFDGKFGLCKDNPMYKSEEDIYLRNESARKQERAQKSQNQDLQYETVDRFSKSKNVKREPERPKQTLTEMLLSRLSKVDSKHIKQKIDVKHNSEDVYGDPRLLHADGQSVYGTSGTSNFDTVGEKVDLLLKEGKAFIVVIVTAERVSPIDMEFNVWRKNQAIVTRTIEVDLLATEHRRRLYYKVMQPTAGSRGNETVLDSEQTLELFTRILDASEGEGDRDDIEVKTSCGRTSRPFSGMDMLY